MASGSTLRKFRYDPVVPASGAAAEDIVPQDMYTVLDMVNITLRLMHS